MKSEFPPAVPEIPVVSIDQAADYYVRCLGFTFDWGDEKGGIAGLSRGNLRLFMTNESFRANYSNSGSVVVWINLDSIDEVNDIHAEWKERGANILSVPESKPWGLHEFTAADLDQNRFRVFHDFASSETSV